MEDTPYDAIFSGIWTNWRDDEDASNTPACQADGVEQALEKYGWVIVKADELQDLRDRVSSLDDAIKVVADHLTDGDGHGLAVVEGQVYRGSTCRDWGTSCDDLHGLKLVLEEKDGGGTNDQGT